MATATDIAQQKDNLCGPFWAARVLRDFGIDADENEIAARAGTILPAPDPGSVPPGAESKTDYTVKLRTGSPEGSGTSAQGLLEAIRASGLECIPIRGEWTAERVARLVAGKGSARLIANVRTGRLWSSKPPVDAVIAELNGDEADGGPSEWDTGHFVELARLIGESLVLVRDSYPSLGWNGQHLQPARLVAAALERGDGREGGVLAVMHAEDADAVRSVAGEIGIWDNGTRR
jgi:hypothetical protein